MRLATYAPQDGARAVLYRYVPADMQESRDRVRSFGSPHPSDFWAARLLSNTGKEIGRWRGPPDMRCRAPHVRRSSRSTARAAVLEARA